MVDASVAVKWFLPEDQTEAARRLLHDDYGLFSPDLIRTEVGNVMWKRWRRSEISSEAAKEALRDLERLQLRIETSEPLSTTAWMVSERFDRSFYDGLYVSLAVQTGCALVTADRELHNALNGSDLDEHLVWVEDIDPSSIETRED